MIVFDTDVLTDILRGVPAIVRRAMHIPAKEQAISIIVAEEILRGRLNAIRQAEAKKLSLPLVSAYELMRESLADLRNLKVLPYTENADRLFHSWRSNKIRVGTRDLRIAAVAVDNRATLISRNRRDFDLVPGLTVEYWS